MTKLELTVFGTASLGVVIDALAVAEPDATVEFDFCYLAPTTVDSYRGHYDHLALGWTDTKHPSFDGEYWPKASALRGILDAAVGADFEGWKGGHYTMLRSTPLWVANRGQAGGTGIVGVDLSGSGVVLLTAKVD